MNKKIIFVFVVMTCLGLMWMLFRKTPKSRPSTLAEVQDQTNQALPSQSLHSTAQRPSPVHTPASGTVVEGVPISQAVIDYTRNSIADPQYDWKQPINFYGKVVDEKNEPVPAASIHFSWNDLSPEGTSKADTKSDENGLFSLTDRQGKRLYVQISKDSYYTSHEARGAAFEYANPADGLFKPDSNYPVVFHLRKKGEGAKLIHRLKLFGSRVEGTLSYVDLTTGKTALTPPGDLTVQCTRSPRNADKKFDWTFTLGVTGGGLVESTDEFMFLAPDGGYQPAYQISHQLTDTNWVGQEKRKFFIRSQDGQHYARIEITIMPEYNQNAAYDLDWYLNPDGSPNLEPDPNQIINIQ